MMSGTLSQTHLAVFPIFAFVLFFALFTGMLVWIFRPGARAIYDARGRMALESDDAAANLNSLEGRHVKQ